ncbi:MAG: hypothetical protein QXM68_03520 [Candidatus Aenigmatarchaeota archaeon]|nr:hypothetical protein [Candidatus Aenigmarchaeota archaeon]
MKKGGVSIALTFAEFIGLLIFVGILVLIFRILSGDVIKFGFEKEKYAEAHKAVSLENYILASPDLIADVNGNAQKGVLSNQKIQNYDGKKLDCCDYIDYDYSIEIKSIDNSEVYAINYQKQDLKLLFDLGKKCNQISGDILMKSYSAPIVIYDENTGSKTLAKMSLYLTKTPISIISEEIFNACINNNYENSVPIYGFHSSELSILKSAKNEYSICLETISGSFMCKRINCEKTINTPKFNSKCQNNDGKCSMTSINSKCGYVLDNDCSKNTCSSLNIISNDKEVNICFSGEKDSAQC